MCELLTGPHPSTSPAAATAAHQQLPPLDIKPLLVEPVSHNHHQQQAPPPPHHHQAAQQPPPHHHPAHHNIHGNLSGGLQPLSTPTSQQQRGTVDL